MLSRHNLPLSLTQIRRDLSTRSYRVSLSFFPVLQVSGIRSQSDLDVCSASLSSADQRFSPIFPVTFITLPCWWTRCAFFEHPPHRCSVFPFLNSTGRHPGFDNERLYPPPIHAPRLQVSCAGPISIKCFSCAERNHVPIDALSSLMRPSCVQGLSLRLLRVVTS